MSMKASDWASVFREATWEEALTVAAKGLKTHPHARRRQGAGRFRLGEVLERRSLSVPETDPAGLRHQQRRSLHAPVSRVVGRSVDGRSQFRSRHRALHGGEGQRLHHRHRRASGRKPPGRRDVSEERSQTRRQADCHGPARPDAGPRPLRLAYPAVQAGHRRRPAECHAAYDHRGRPRRRAVHPGHDRGLRGPAKRRSKVSRPRPWQSWPASRPPPSARLPACTRARKSRSSSGAWACPSIPTAPTTPVA